MPCPFCFLSFGWLSRNRQIHSFRAFLGPPFARCPVCLTRRRAQHTKGPLQFVPVVCIRNKKFSSHACSAQSHFERYALRLCLTWRQSLPYLLRVCVEARIVHGAVLDGCTDWSKSRDGRLPQARHSASLRGVTLALRQIASIVHRG